MSIHRGIVVAAFTVVLATSACDSDSSDEVTRPAPSASTTATPTPTVQASRDPAADRIPLAGDDDVTISWVLEKVDDSDPVVDVARRTISLMLLATWSTAWADDQKVDRAAATLSDHDAALAQPLSRAATPTERNAPKVVRVLVQAPVVSGDRATAWLCLDQNATASRSKGGTLVSVRLQVTNGLWKVTDYNLNPEITPKLEPRFKRCRAGY